MRCRITQSSDVHRTESVSVMDYEQTMGVSSRVLDPKQQNIFGRISLFWSVELQGHPEQLNGGDHDWLIQTPVSKIYAAGRTKTLTCWIAADWLNGFSQILETAIVMYRERQKRNLITGYNS